MSVLETYKKQAKQLPRWHRERNYSVGGRVRQLPRYRDVTDHEALALDFKLAEARDIIALEAGYDRWAALRAAVEDVSPRPPEAPKPVLLDAARRKGSSWPSSTLEASRSCTRSISRRAWT
jgi:hypothetical protein